MNMKSMFVGSIIAVLCAGQAFAKAETKQQAGAFLAKYCFELVNAIEDAYKDKKELASKGK